jgi:olefin beta-lactone synthetase
MSAVCNIASPLVKMARRQPDTPAFLGIESDTLSHRFTYRQLDDESNRLARGLAKLGLSRGMRAVLMVPPSVEFFALTFALFKLGCVVVLIDPGMGVRNLAVCLAEAEPEAFVGVPKAHLARIILGWAKKSLKFQVTVGTRFLWGGWTLDRVRREGENGKPILASTTTDETAAILFTSGSTGVAKGAVYTHGIFTAQVEMLRRIYGIEPGEIDLPTFPLFGLFGPALGMTAVLPRMDFTRPGGVDPDAILGPARKFGVTNLFGSPALLRRVAFSGEASGVKLTSLRRVISAGAPVSPAVIRKVVELLPPGVQVHTPYGATEALPVATIGSDEILGETGSLTSQGKGVCVGRPVEGMHVRILRISDDPIPTWSDDLELPRGEVGEIAVSGPVVTRSYYNRPRSTALHKIHEGERVWHRMGDVGYLDERGRIWFCGRKSHRVVAPSATYFTIPVEGVFNAHPAVFRTALVGVARAGVVEPELCVEVEPGQRPDPVALRRDLAALGSKYDHTRAIRRFHVHPRFPVDIRHNAKIFREKLAVWAGRQTGGLVT